MFDRFQDISAFDLEKILPLARQGKKPIIQFTAPKYTAGLLEQIDAACAELGGDLEVRFYGHRHEGFDARWLQHLPNVANLSLDCLQTVTHIERISGLHKLRHLSLGVHELNCPEVLSQVPADALEGLRLDENRKNDFDLLPLVRFHKLKSLQIAGHTRSLGVLGGLQSVSTLCLRCIGKKQSLDAVNQMKALDKLEIILGGRPNIDEISHSGLSDLRVTWVRGLATLGDLSRFPALETLRVSDQLQLHDIELSRAQNSLKSLWILNCKNLKKLGGIGNLSKFEELRLGRTAIDYGALLQDPLPASLRSIDIFTGSKRKDDVINQRLASLGYPIQRP
jgi:hypothetical protein